MADKQQWFSYKPKSCSSFMDFFCPKLVKYPFLENACVDFKLYYCVFFILNLFMFVPMHTNGKWGHV
jgi:hypothetical protein